MGKRSRKRASTDAGSRIVSAAQGAPGTAARGRPVGRKSRMEEAPAALWAPVPVTELLILVGLVLVLVGFFSSGGTTLLAVGLVLVSFAALELAIREHFAGYRSHSTLLAASAAAALGAPLFVAGIAPVALLAVFALVFALGFHLLREAFGRRAGGLKFRA